MEKSSRLCQLQYIGYIYSKSAYIYCVYIVSRINSERNNNIHLLGWKFVAQSGNDTNTLTKITRANSFLALVLNHSPSRKLKITSPSDKLSSGLTRVPLSWMQWWTAVCPQSTVFGFQDFSLCWWYDDTSLSLIHLIRSNYILSDHQSTSKLREADYDVLWSNTLHSATQCM